MATDQQVSARAVLDAVMELRRRGSRQALQELEQVEPDLASYLMESLSDVHQKLLALGGPAKASRRLYDDMQSLALVCIAALRKGHYELWRQSDAGAKLDPPDSGAAPLPSDDDGPQQPDS